jgi:hypothetical protein
MRRGQTLANPERAQLTQLLIQLGMTAASYPQGGHATQAEASFSYWVGTCSDLCSDPRLSGGDGWEPIGMGCSDVPTVPTENAERWRKPSREEGRGRVCVLPLTKFSLFFFL